VGDLSDFQRGQIVGARLAGIIINKAGNLSGASRAGYNGTFRSWEDIIS